MKHISLITILLLILTSSSNCKKGGLFGDKLPAATQEGKNICGFLVNGKVWLPRGDNGYPNINCFYDETYNGGTFGINGYRFEPNSTTSTHFAIGGNKITATGIYKLNLSDTLEGRYSIAVRPTGSCFYDWYDTITNHNSYLKITKLDKVNRIVAGTFEFAQVKQGCQEVRITQGRFDMKY